MEFRLHATYMLEHHHLASPVRHLAALEPDLVMRKPLTILILCGYLVGYIAIAATIGGMLTKVPVWLQLSYFAIAGVLWVFPLKPLFAWMHRDPKAHDPSAD